MEWDLYCSRNCLGYIDLSAGAALTTYCVERCFDCEMAETIL